MWTKRLTSPSPEFPQRIDLIQHLLEQLIQKQILGSWLHLETVKEGSFLKGLFSGQPSFIEVGFNENHFELNLGFQKAEQLKAPSNWQEIKKGLLSVPRSDSDALRDWIDDFLNKTCSTSSGKNVSGWIDGL